MGAIEEFALAWRKPTQIQLWCVVLRASDAWPKIEAIFLVFNSSAQTCLEGLAVTNRYRSSSVIHLSGMEAWGLETVTGAKVLRLWEGRDFQNKEILKTSTKYFFTTYAASTRLIFNLIAYSWPIVHFCNTGSTYCCEASTYWTFFPWLLRWILPRPPA